MSPPRKFLLLSALLLVPLSPLGAQTPEEPDTLYLEVLREAAARQDPRAAQPELLSRASRLRLAALHAQRLPQLTLFGQASVQNEVPSVGIEVPGFDVPVPPREQYRAQLEADWTLYDGGRIGRQASAERARLDEELAGVGVMLYALREAATDAFFAALLHDSRMRTLGLSIEDLDARLRVVRLQADLGAALQAEAAALEAERIRLRQQAAEAESARRATLSVLSLLTGLAVPPSSVLALPDLEAEVARAVAVLAHGLHPQGSVLDRRDDLPLSARPELDRLVRAAARAEAEARVREAQLLPAISVFGQAGVGRPSPFNFLSDDVSEFGIAGVRLRWSVFDWGRVRREAQAVRVQALQAETEAAAFVARISREIQNDLKDLERLVAAIADDQRAVTLREEVVRTARRQLEEGVILSDTYTNRLTSLEDARFTLERRRIELARAQARLLSTLGRFPERSLPMPRDAGSNHE